MQQVPLQDWPIGLEHDAAFLRIAAGEISRRTQISFANAADDLDIFAGAVIRVNGTMFALQKYTHSPVRGTKVIVKDGTRRSIDAIVDMLNLKRSDISWVAPPLSGKLSQALRRRVRAQVGRVERTRLKLPERSFA